MYILLEEKLLLCKLISECTNISLMLSKCIFTYYQNSLLIVEIKWKLFFFQCLDEYEDDEAGQKERKREDAITQQNTMQNEAVNLLDPGSSYLLQVSI